jgi:hypothetical protein
VLVALVCPLSAALLEAALPACPAALLVLELSGLLAPFAALLVLVPLAAFTVLGPPVPPTPFAPVAPLVSLVPVVSVVSSVCALLAVVLLLLSLFVLLGPPVLCAGSRGGRTGSVDEIGDRLMMVRLAENP